MLCVTRKSLNSTMVRLLLKAYNRDLQGLQLSQFHDGSIIMDIFTFVHLLGAKSQFHDGSIIIEAPKP